jgi:hypothetical protein
MHGEADNNYADSNLDSGSELIEMNTSNSNIDIRKLHH